MLRVMELWSSGREQESGLWVLVPRLKRCLAGIRVDKEMVLGKASTAGFWLRHLIPHAGSFAQNHHSFSSREQMNQAPSGTTLTVLIPT